MRKCFIFIIIAFLLTVGLMPHVPTLAVTKVQPKVLSAYPGNGIIEAGLNKEIKITFAKAIKKGSNFKNIKFQNDKGSLLKCNISVNKNVLTIKVVQELKDKVKYILTIPEKSVADYSSNTTNKKLTYNFKAQNTKLSNNQKGNETTKTNPINSGTEKQTTTSSAVDVSNSKPSSQKFAVHAFYSGLTKYDANMENYLRGLSSVSFAWLSLENQNGSVVLDDKNSKMDFHVPDDYDKPLEFCKDNSIPAQIAIFSDGNTAKSIISNDSLRKDLIKKIIESLKMPLPNNEVFDFNGVVIDFEGFRQDDTMGYFNTFLSELKPQLQAINKKLYVAVNVRAYYPGYDYSQILNYSDKVILMAHNYEPGQDLTKAQIDKYINYNSNDPIFTLAPINLVQNALEDLISSAKNKDDIKKIWLQINFGITQWQFSAGSIDNWNSIDPSAIGNRVNPTYDMLIDRLHNSDCLGTNFVSGYINELESPYLTYYNSGSETFNFILYEDSRSVKAKINLSKLEGIGGISLWRLGNIPSSGDDTVNKYNLDLWDAIISSSN